MWPNPQQTPDLVTFTEEILNGKLHFLCSVCYTDRNIIVEELKLQAVRINKISQHFRKMSISLWLNWQAYSETCIFCVKQRICFQKQSMWGALKVLATSLKTVFDEVFYSKFALSKFNPKIWRLLGAIARLFLF